MQDTGIQRPLFLQIEQLYGNGKREITSSRVKPKRVWRLRCRKQDSNSALDAEMSSQSGELDEVRHRMQEVRGEVKVPGLLSTEPVRCRYLSERDRLGIVGNG